VARVKRGSKRRQRRKKILERASGYFLTKSKLFRAARLQVEKGLRYAYRDRRQRKRQFRSLWIVRIGAAARLHQLTYNQFIHGLKLAGVELDRKILADLAVRDAPAFATLAGQARTALAAPRKAAPVGKAPAAEPKPASTGEAVAAEPKAAPAGEVPAAKRKPAPAGKAPAAKRKPAPAGKAPAAKRKPAPPRKRGPEN
jgi:large subunit ribosomal protein L20